MSDDLRRLGAYIAAIESTLRRLEKKLDAVLDLKHTPVGAPKKPKKKDPNPLDQPWDIRDSELTMGQVPTMDPNQL